MKTIDILNKYKDCDTFSLTKMVSDERLTDEELDNAVKEIKKHFYDDLKKLYSKYENQPDFEVLYNDIEEEVNHFASKHSYKLVKEVGSFEYSFICDFVGVDTKYSEPLDLYWHFYHSMGFMKDCEVLCADYYGDKDPLNIDDVLKRNLINYKVGFVSHCTIGGYLQMTYYFKLNDETKEYLLRYKDLFSFNTLEDLALYKDNELKMTSCTHEMYFEEK